MSTNGFAGLYSETHDDAASCEFRRSLGIAPTVPAEVSAPDAAAHHADRYGSS